MRPGVCLPHELDQGGRGRDGARAILACRDRGRPTLRQLALNSNFGAGTYILCSLYPRRGRAGERGAGSRGSRALRTAAGRINRHGRALARLPTCSQRLCANGLRGRARGRSAGRPWLAERDPLRDRGTDRRCGCALGRSGGLADRRNYRPHGQDAIKFEHYEGAGRPCRPAHRPRWANPTGISCGARGEGAALRAVAAAREAICPKGRAAEIALTARCDGASPGELRFSPRQSCAALYAPNRLGP